MSLDRQGEVPGDPAVSSYSPALSDSHGGVLETAGQADGAERTFGVFVRDLG